MVRALLDALAWLNANVGNDIGAYRWGALHTTRFEALIPLFGALSIPPPGDQVFPEGFPRHGDNFGLDVSGFSLSVRLDKAPNFRYAHGPVQRFVIDLDPAGPRAWNALPGGAVWDSQSTHFRDQAELWRKNQTRLVPFLLPDVVAAAETRTVVSTP
jgi:penicillin amidase